MDSKTLRDTDHGITDFCNGDFSRPVPHQAQPGGSKHTKACITLIALLLIFTVFFATTAGAAGPTRTIEDQLGRKVTIPVNVERVVVLMHHALIIMLELGAQDQIVGVMEKWDSYIAGAIRESWPDIEKAATPGDLRTVNVEEILKIKPDVVIITHYAIETVGKQLEAVGVPTVGLSLYKADYEQASILNPKLKDPDRAYTEGLKKGILLLGDILGKQERARKLIDEVISNRKLVEERISKLKKEDRITTYMAYPDMYSMGHGKYAMVAMERAGGLNVAAEINGYQKVNMEDVLRWDPQVVFTQARYRTVADEIKNTEAWQAVDAVKNGRIYITPEYVKPWGHCVPESLALGELWLAKKLHPKLFEDIDMQVYVDRFYRTFYGIPYTGGH